MSSHYYCLVKDNLELQGQKSQIIMLDSDCHIYLITDMIFAKHMSMTSYRSLYFKQVDKIILCIMPTKLVEFERKP